MLLGSPSSRPFLLVIPFFVCILLLLHHASADAGLRSDGQALLLFLVGAGGDPGRLNWSSTTSPCEWTGVKCSGGKKKRVVSVQLPGSGLTGIIPHGTLGSLPHLQSISLRANRLKGPIPSDILRCTALRKLVLRHNLLNSTIPSFSPSSSPFLSVLDLSFNRFHGPIPPSLARFPRLKSILLQNNNLSGTIPPFLGVGELNVSDNRLSGSIPPSLATKFHASSFDGNADLCGAPLPRVCPVPPPPPSTGLSSEVSAEEHRPKKQLSRLAVALVAAGAGAVVLLITVCYAIWFYSLRRGRPKRQAAASAAEMSKSSSSSGVAEVSKWGAAGGGGGKGGGDVEEYSSAQDGAEQEQSKLVFFHHGGAGGQMRFDLEDLLRASAEVLGKGMLGTSYRAVLEEGPTVVVKRLKDAGVGRREFEQHMDAAAKMTHPNLLPIRAYYYSKQEKLLVHDYLPLGNLSLAIHGRKALGEAALDWETRIRVAGAAARGLEYLHSTGAKAVHGDVKPSNILLHRESGACLSDYGLAALLGGAPAARMGVAAGIGYRAPELAQQPRRGATQKSDVYSFGVVLLELLTAKAPAQTTAQEGMDLPKWVQSVVREEWTSEVFDRELMRFPNIEEEMVHMLQIALSCVSTSPDQRPSMSDVCRMILDLRPASFFSGPSADPHSKISSSSTSSSSPDTLNGAASAASPPPPAASVPIGRNSPAAAPPVSASPDS